MLVTTKIKDIHELAAELASVRRGRTVVQCHGVFDLLHIGHIRHFQEAKKSGRDPGRHRHAGSLRQQGPASAGVHRSAARGSDCVARLRRLRRHQQMADRGRGDRADSSRRLRQGLRLRRCVRPITPAASRSNGTRSKRSAASSLFTDEITFSSSIAAQPAHVDLLAGGERLPDGVSPQVLGERRHRPASAGAHGLRVLVVGEAIIDEYQYCETLGKSGKEPILAAQFVRSEKFVGGAWRSPTTWPHAAPTCGSSRCSAPQDSHEELIRGALSPGVAPDLLIMEGAPTLVKRRFIETYPFQKLFEVYVMDEEAAAAEIGRPVRAARDGSSLTSTS